MYLIGGAPCVGKSTYAKQLAVEHGAKIIELDALMPEWNAAVPLPEHAAKLPVWQAKKEHREPTAEEYRIEAETYWPMIRERLQALLKMDGSWVVEGAQLQPKLLRSWLDELGASAPVHVTFLCDDASTHPLNAVISEEAKRAGFAVVGRRTE